jgi:plastocyanin
MRAAPLAAALVVAAGWLVAGCGDGSEPTVAAGCHVASGGEVTVVAEDLAWDTDCLEATPGALTIVVVNRDEGVQHNLHLPDAPEDPKTPLAPGASTQELDLTLEAGAYRYLCDIHPNMVGMLKVAAAS